jgi:hypothetical protein
VIFPNRLLEDNPDFIVNLRNARVLGMLETDEPYFEGKGHSGFSVNWSPDSTAVLVEIGGRWWPQDLVLIEMKGGKIFRQTGLLDQLGKIFSVALAKVKRTGGDQARVDTEVSEFDVAEVTWKTGRGLQLQITCEASTNPKGSPQQSTWEGKLVAVWDVAQQKFSQQRVTQTSFSPAEKEE